MNLTASQRPIIFGEVLFDRFPDGTAVLGGAPFNVAWHLQAFGLSPLFISCVGDDTSGRQVKASMLEWGMDISGLQLDSVHPTGSVDIRFSDGEPHYDIVCERAYDYIDADSLPPLATGGVLYHGTLALRNRISEMALARIKQVTSASVFIDVNLRQPWWKSEAVRQLMMDGRWIKLNGEELAQIVPHENSKKNRIDYLLSTLPLEILVVTEGKEGAIAVSVKGEQCEVLPKISTRVVDTVGAGDAFSSVLLIGQARGWPLPLTLQRAQQFAGAVIGIQGAIVNDRNFYWEFVNRWG